MLFTFVYLYIIINIKITIKCESRVKSGVNRSAKEQRTYVCGKQILSKKFPVRKYLGAEVVVWT